ncbi:MAG TPA: ROK family protein [Casimicrobiaceae bacterium]|nr:ROK family protein [Casimicrobiaceae bacterium]
MTPASDHRRLPRIGIDLGGSKTEIIALDAAGQALLRRRVATPQGDYEATLETIAGLVATAEAELRCEGGASIGVGTPGALSRATGLMRNCNSTWLNDRPLPVDLSRRLGRAVAIANDANCFALSEATDGAAANADCVFGAILGTGVGGGIVVHGSVLEGINAIAGEWGHNPLPRPRDDERSGPECYCGRRGCIETYLSGPGMARDHARSTGESLTPETIVERSQGGDAQCGATISRYEERLARSLAHIINVLDPDVIVLGGGLSNLDRLFTNVPKLWQRSVFSDRVDTRLVRPAHGDSSGVRGAAWLGAGSTRHMLP